MGKFIDLTGQRFGRLVVVERVENDKFNKVLWKCQCDCGNVVYVISSSLKNGSTQSCGCLRKDVVKLKNIKSKGRIGRIKDITGQKFGKLLVLEPVFNYKENDKHMYWKCKCDCGNEIITLGKSLRRGHTKSCGCYNLDQIRIEKYEGSYNSLYNSYIANAQKRGHEFNLKKEYFRKLTSSNCSYCGAEPNMLAGNSKHFGRYSYNGIDRIDNNIGYINGNTVPCCKQCNYMKRTMTKNEFFLQIKNIYNHSVKGKE